MFVPRSVKRKRETESPQQISLKNIQNAPSSIPSTGCGFNAAALQGVVGNVLTDIVNKTVINLMAGQARQQLAGPSCRPLQQPQVPLHNVVNQPSLVPGQSLSVAQLFAAARNQANVNIMNVGALCSSGAVPVFSRNNLNRPGTSSNSNLCIPNKSFQNVSWVPNQTSHGWEPEIAKRIGKFCPPRQWEMTEAGKHYERRPSQHRGFDFTVMSYNVLAQDLLEDNIFLYSHCDSTVLTWTHRRERLLQEIRHLNPDIVCLQEVNEKHYKEVFKPRLNKCGYSSEFVKRTGQKQDGCATFYRTSKFSLEDTKKVKYYHPKGRDVLDRDNVALIVKLRPIGGRAPSNRRLCVSNTHLLFNPRRGDVKLAQLMVLLAEMDKMAHINNGSSQETLYHSVVMCGDFNSEPHSEVYKLLTMGYLEYEGLMIRDISGQHDLRPGRETFLSRDFFPAAVGIDDNCQYCDVVQSRKGLCTSSTSHINDVKMSSGENKKGGSSKKGEKSKKRKDDGEGVKIGKSISSKKSGNGKEEDARDEREDSGECIYIDDSEKSNNNGDSNKRGESNKEGESSKKGESNKERNGNKGGESSEDCIYIEDSEESNQSCDIEMTCLQNTGILQHQLKLVSAYGHMTSRHNHNFDEVTTHHGRSSCTVDYIFYGVHSGLVKFADGKVKTKKVKEANLSLLGRYGLMADHELKGMGSLPNRHLGSDHLSLMSKFLMS